ncbi:MAG: 3-oxoacyl-ACP synthase III [Pirellulales bacterium]
MRYQHVVLESFGYTLPDEVVETSAIERRLAPLYRRLRLPEGRLELITGIRERRFWEAGVLPSDKSVESAEKALATAGISRDAIGALIHASVCRDFLEPATASGVHHRLGLPHECLVYDVSNACLGILDGMVQIANMIELGQIRAGLVVGTEGSRQLVETTIERLNTDDTLSRSGIKESIASLTIGSASVAVLLCDRELSQTGSRMMAATALANTAHHGLCQSGRDESVAGGMRPLMTTDSERLMHEGIATGVATLSRFLDESGWTRDDIDRSFCHQVGVAHRKRMLEALQLDPARDFITVETLGNTGSVALPITMAMAAEQGMLKPDDRVAMLGIGSGINCLMLAVQWQPTLAPRRAAQVGERPLASVAGS